MPNVVSMCCGASIEIGSRTEYPLGGRTWGVNHLVDVCGGCGQEAEPVHTCGYCGSEINGDNPEITGTDRCYICIGEVMEMPKVARTIPYSPTKFDLWRLSEAGGQVGFDRKGMPVFQFGSQEQFEKYLQLNEKRGVS